MMKQAVCAAILTIAAQAAFASNTASETAATSAAAAVANPVTASSSPATAVASKGPIAKQGEATVDVLDVDAHLQAVPPKDRGAYLDSPKRIEQMLSHILLRRNLALEAKELGLDKGEIMQRRMELAIEDVLMARRLEYLQESIKVPDLETLARERYLSDGEKYRLPETVSVVHVLLETKERTPQEAIALLEGWRKDVAAGKTTLEEVAKKHSNDPGVGTNGGLYADSNPASFVPEFAAAIAALKLPGELSPPVKTEFGYHLIQLKERKAARLPAFAEIKDQLVAQARERFLGDSTRAHVDALRTLPVEASEATVEPLRRRYGGDPARQSPDTAAAPVAPVPVVPAAAAPTAAVPPKAD